MTKTEKINDCEWKPVTLESTLLSNGIEGLIGIEELTDYSLERSNKKGKIFTTEVRSTNEKVRVFLNSIYICIYLRIFNMYH